MKGVPSLPAAFRQFVRLFNAGQYWESHEVLEEPWRRNHSRFYQGLIILASAYVHRKHGKALSYERQLHKARPYLEPYRPYYLGLDIAEVVEMIDVGLASGTASDQTPHLLLRRECVRGDELELSD